MAIETTQTETELSDLYKFDETTGTINPVDYPIVEDIVKNGVCTAMEVDPIKVNMSTPMGRVLEWWSLFGTMVLGLNVQNANQMLVSAAAGQQLDAMAQWFQLSRKPSSYSTVTVRCYGGTNDTITPIPQGSTVRNENGDYFESTEDAEIPAGNGTYVDVPFEAISEGPIGVAAGTVNIVGTPIAGWESCTNPQSGVLGAAIETDESLRERIMSARTVAPGFLGAIKNAVDAIVGSGGSVMALENNTGEHLEVHGIDMLPHSILVCVDGLTSPTDELVNSDEKVLAVAKAIFDNKPSGTGYTLVADSRSYTEAHNPDGTLVSTSDYQYDVTVTDDFGNPYHVFFCAPLPQTITITIQVKKRGYNGINLISDVTNAIESWANATNFGVGEDIYSSSIIKAVEAAVEGIIVVDCNISDGGGDKGTPFLEIDGIHSAQLDKKNIIVTEY